MYNSELQKFNRTKKSLNLPLNVMLVVLVTWLSEHGMRQSAMDSPTIASAPREEVQETQNVKIIVKTYLGMCFKV